MNIKTLLPLIFLIALILFFFNSQTASLISFGELGTDPPQTIPISFDGVDGTATSVYFGSVTNGQIVFCGNDGDVKISNNLLDGDALKLTSTIETEKRLCASNYIRADIDVPIGILRGYCLTSIKSDPSGNGRAYCKVAGKEYGDGSFEIIFNEPQKIEAWVITSPSEQSAYSVEASADLTLNFEKKTQEEIQNIEPTQQTGVESSVYQPNFLQKIWNWIKSLWYAVF